MKKKKKIEKGKVEVEAKLKEISSQVLSLEKEVEVVKSTASSREEQLNLMSSSASDAEKTVLKLQREVEEAVAEKDKVTKDMNMLRQEKDSLQQSVDAFEMEKTKMQTEKQKLTEEMEKAQSLIDDMSSQLNEVKIRESNSKVAADSERDALMARLQSSESAVKERDLEITNCKKEIENLKGKLTKKATENIPQPTQPKGADTEGMARKLRETEDLLQAVETEKQSAESQVEFLNSVIVDLQRKNEEQAKKIEMLVTGNVADTNGALFDLSDDDEPVRPGIKQRLFCDICDIFDAHDTDDCPTQSSGLLDDQGTQYHGNRNEERPYCDICEMFGHWTQDCDDEETF